MRSGPRCIGIVRDNRTNFVSRRSSTLRSIVFSTHASAWCITVEHFGGSGRYLPTPTARVDRGREERDHVPASPRFAELPVIARIAARQILSATSSRLHALSATS